VIFNIYFCSRLYKIKYLAVHNMLFKIQVPILMPENRGWDFLVVPPAAGYFGSESG